MSVFSTVGGARPHRTRFKIRKRVTGNCGFFELIPFFARLGVPRDSWRLSNNCVIRFEPQQAPFNSDVWVNIDYFKVPIRLIDENFVDFIENKKVEPGEDKPDVSRYPASSVRGKYSVEDYLGLPLGVDLHGVIDWWRRAYNLIWNTYYRDEWTQDEVALDNSTILHKGWQRDYFTSCLPEQQYGDSPSFPIEFPDDLSALFPDVKFNGLAWGEFSGSATSLGAYSSPYGYSVPPIFQFGGKPFLRTYGETSYPVSMSPLFVRDVFGGSVVADNPVFGNHDNNAGGFVPVGLHYTDEHPISINSLWNVTPPGDEFSTQSWMPATYNLNDNSIDLSDVTVGFNMNDMRTAWQIQRFQEREQRSGLRHDEFLQAMYGTSPRDETLQKPVFLGRTSQRVVTSEVLQTSSTLDAEGKEVGKGVGAFAGHSMSVGSNVGGRCYCEEFCIIMGIMSVTVKPQYCQGVPRELLYRSWADFFNPLFVGLSEQGVWNGELFWQGNGGDDDSEDYGIFGFQGRYNEMRVDQDTVVGDLRPKIPGATGSAMPFYSYWTLARYFDELPTLSSDFIEGKIEDPRIFTVTDVDHPQIIFDIGQHSLAARPLPFFPEPGRVDHF